MKHGKKNKIVTKKRVILIVAIIIAITAGGFIAKIKFESDEARISTKAESTEDLNNKEDLSNNEDNSESDKDNSGYLSLEKDSNAEDAITVFHTTEKLLKNEIKYPVRTDGKKVAFLTFDDGPSTTNTPKVLDILKENNIKATFMILGSKAEESEESKEILKRTVKEGHAIGNHTYCHDYHYLYPNNVISPTNFMADVDKCNQTLKSILGKDFNTRVIRFPGEYWSWEGRTGIRPILDEKGYAIVDWNSLSKDAEGEKDKSAEKLIAVSKEEIDKLGKDADNVVFLMHDTYGKEETVKSLQGIIDLFKERGFEFKTMK